MLKNILDDYFHKPNVKFFAFMLEQNEGEAIEFFVYLFGF